MNVLLAIDASPCSEAAVSTLRDQLNPARAVVRVLHVVQWPHDVTAAVTFAEGPSAAACVLEAHEEARRRARSLVDRAVSRLKEAGFNATSHVVEGEPRRAILAMATEWPADTIVLGSHGRKGLDRLLLGSVSRGVVNEAPCSVQVVREAPTTVRIKEHIAF